MYFGQGGDTGAREVRLAIDSWRDRSSPPLLIGGDAVNVVTQAWRVPVSRIWVKKGAGSDPENGVCFLQAHLMCLVEAIAVGPLTVSSDQQFNRCERW